MFTTIFRGRYRDFPYIPPPRAHPHTHAHAHTHTHSLSHHPRPPPDGAFATTDGPALTVVATRRPRCALGLTRRVVWSVRQACGHLCLPLKRTEQFHSLRQASPLSLHPCLPQPLLIADLFYRLRSFTFSRTS